MAGGIIPITAHIRGKDTLSPSLNKINRQFRFISTNLRFADAAAAELTSRFAMLASNAGDAFLGVTNDAVKSGTDLEFKMTRIGAIANLSSDKLDFLRNSFIDLGRSVPFAADELAEIGTIAARMGIETPEAIAAVAESASKLSVIAEDLDHTKAVEGLAQSVRIMFGSMKDGEEGFREFQDNVTKTTSALVASAAAATTSEGQLINFITRMGGAAKMIGLTTDEVIGFSAAATDIGLKPERSARAFMKLFSQLQRKADVMSAVLGITQEQYMGLFRTQGGGREVLLSFLKIINKLESVKPGTGLQFLDLLGLGSQGPFVQLYTGLAGNIGNVNKQLGVAKDAFHDGTIQTRFFNKFMDSTSMKMMHFNAILKNTKFIFSESLVKSMKPFIDFGNQAVTMFFDLDRSVVSFVAHSIVAVGSFLKITGSVLGLVASLSSLRFVFFLMTRTLYPELISANQRLGGYIFGIIRHEMRFFRTLIRNASLSVFSIKAWLGAFMTLGTFLGTLTSVMISLGIAAGTIGIIGVPAFIAVQKVGSKVYRTIELLIDLFAELSKNSFKLFKNLFKNAKPFLDPINSFFSGIADSVDSFNRSLYESVGLFKTSFEGFSGDTSDFKDRFFDFWDNIGEQPKYGAKKLQDRYAEINTFTQEALLPKSLLERIVDGVSAFFRNSGIFSDIKFGIFEAIDGISNSANLLKDSMVEIFSPLDSFIKDSTFKLTSKNIEGFLTSIFESSKTMIGIIKKSFKALWVSMGGENELGIIKDALKSTVSSITSFLGGFSLDKDGVLKKIESFMVSAFTKIGNSIAVVIELFKLGGETFKSFIGLGDKLSKRLKDASGLEKLAGTMVFLLPFLNLIELGLFKFVSVLDFLGMSIGGLIPRLLILGSVASIITIFKEFGLSIKDFPYILKSSFSIIKDSMMAFWTAMNGSEVIPAFILSIKKIISNIFNLKEGTEDAFSSIKSVFVGAFEKMGGIASKFINLLKIGAATVSSFFGVFPSLWENLKGASLVEKMTGSFLIFLPVLAAIIRAFTSFATILGFSSSVIYWFTYSARGVFIAFASTLLATFGIFTLIIPTLEDLGLSFSAFGISIKDIPQQLSNIKDELLKFLGFKTDPVGLIDEEKLENASSFISKISDMAKNGFKSIALFFGVFPEFTKDFKPIPGFMNELSLFLALIPGMLLLSKIIGFLKLKALALTLLSPKIFLFTTSVAFFFEKMNALGLTFTDVFGGAIVSFKKFIAVQKEGKGIASTIQAIWQKYVMLAAAGTSILSRFFGVFESAQMKYRDLDSYTKFFALIVSLPPFLAAFGFALKKINAILRIFGLNLKMLFRGFMLGAPIALALVLLDNFGISLNVIGIYLKEVAGKAKKYFNEFLIVANSFGEKLSDFAYNTYQSITEIFKEWSPFLKEAFVQIWNDVLFYSKAIWPYLKATLNFLVNNVKEIYQALSRNIKDVSLMAAYGILFLGVSFLTFSKAALPVFLLTMGKVAGLIAISTAAIRLMGNYFGKTGEKIAIFASVLGGMLLFGAGAKITALYGALVSLSYIFKEFGLIPTIATAIGIAVAGLAYKFGLLNLSMIPLLLKLSIVGAVAYGAYKIFTWLDSKLGEFPASIITVTGALFGLVGVMALLSGASIIPLLPLLKFAAIAAGISLLVYGIGKLLYNIWNDPSLIKKYFMKLVEYGIWGVGKLIIAQFEITKALLAGIWKVVKTLAEWVGDSIVGAFAYIAGWFDDELPAKITGAWNTVKNQAKQLFEWMGDTLFYYLQEAWDKFSSLPPVEWVLETGGFIDKKAIAKSSDVINKYFGDLFKSNSLEIPKLSGDLQVDVEKVGRFLREQFSGMSDKKDQLKETIRLEDLFRKSGFNTNKLELLLKEQSNIQKKILEAEIKETNKKLSDFIPKDLIKEMRHLNLLGPNKEITSENAKSLSLDLLKSLRSYYLSSMKKAEDIFRKTGGRVHFGFYETYDKNMKMINEAIDKISPQKEPVNEKLDETSRLNTLQQNLNQREEDNTAPIKGKLKSVSLNDSQLSISDNKPSIFSNLLDFLGGNKKDEKSNKPEASFEFGDITIPINLEIDGYEIANHVARISGEELKIRFGKPNFRNRGASSPGGVII